MYLFRVGVISVSCQSLNKNVIRNVAIIRKVLAPTGGHLKPAPAVTAHSDGSPAGQWRLRLTN